MNQATIDFIKQWIIKADEDLLVVAKLTEYEIIAAGSVCFHCQQSVEKFLKAFLIANNTEIRKTHNIEFLLSECSEFDVDFLSIDSKNLSDFGVEVRYPGDMFIPDIIETLEYKSIAIQVGELVKTKLKLLLNS